MAQLTLDALLLELQRFANVRGARSARESHISLSDCRNSQFLQDALLTEPVPISLRRRLVQNGTRMRNTVISSIDEVDRLIDDEDVKTRQHKVLLVLGLAGISFEAFYLAVLSSGTEPMTVQLGLSANQVGLVSAYGYMATLVAAICCGMIADRFGRVRIMVAAKVITLVALLLMGTAPTFLVLVIGRCIAGAAFGVDLGVAMAYLAENLPRKRQHLLSFWQAQWFISTVLGLMIVLGLYRLDVGLDVWRWALVVASGFAVLVGIAQATTMPESPRWLARQGKSAELARSIRRIYQIDATIRIETSETAFGDVRATKWADLFQGEYLRRTILVSIVITAVSMTYYAVAYYLPVIALALFGRGFGQAIFGSIVFNLFGIVGGVASIWVGRRFGVRKGAQYGFALVALMILVLGVFFDSLPIALAFAVPALFILFYAAGPASASLAMSATAYPTELRGRGGQLGAVGQAVGGILGLYAFPNLAEAIGMGATIMLFAVVPLTGAVACAIIKWDGVRSADGSSVGSADDADAPRKSGDVSVH